MVFKKSEYQNQFKSSTVNNNQSVYLENLTFRHNRRDREFLHTPLAWQDQQSSEEVQSSDEESNTNFNCNSIAKSEEKSNEPKYQSLAEILDESKAKSLAFRQQKQDVSSSQEINKSTDNKTSLDTEEGSSVLRNEKDYSIYDIVDDCEKLRLKKNHEDKSRNGEKNEKENVIDREGYVDRKQSKSNLKAKGNRKKKVSSSRHVVASSQTEQSNGYHHRPDSAACQVPSLPIGPRPRRPDRQKRIPSANCRPASLERPPFVAYGAGDREDTFTTHRTHNVRSDVDVYSAALRAKIRREEEKKRQMQRQKRLTQSTNDLMEKLASLTPRDACDWRSEYQKQFHGYEPKVYERSSSRAVISHSVPIRAVHRGGGLIVHVD